MAEETIFTWGAPPLKFGPGAADEVGFEMTGFGVRRVLIVTDHGVSALGAPQRIADALRRYEIESEIFDGVHVEPTDDSMNKAVEYARAQGEWDGFIAVGGGSAIDTAKAINLLTSHPGELMDYINKPIGKAKVPPGALKPLIAIPTTAGTGSESTAMCILDILSMKVKTGISHWRLRPTLAVIDPLLTMSLPSEVTAASGMDIVCHAVESYTAKYYTQFDPKQPEERVTYCGSNPVSDLWCEKAMSLIATSFRASVHEGSLEHRSNMLMAATFAGMGFGNAGVHIPHANAYPIAGGVRDFRPDGYPDAEPLIPHGMAVSLTAPEAFRFTFESCPERHLRAARLLGDRATEASGRPSEVLPAVLTSLMRDIGMPNGLAMVGYQERDIATLVDGAMKQQRLLATAPRSVAEGDLVGIFARSLTLWS